MKISLLPLAALSAVLLVAPAAAETGGAGRLPTGYPLPAEYRSARGPAGLRLLDPPAQIDCNSDGEAGSVRLYGGVRWSRTSLRRRVRSMRVSLLRPTGSSPLISQFTLPPRRGWQYGYMDRIGESQPDATCGKTYAIRYSFRIGDRRKKTRVDYRVTVRPAEFHQ